MNQKANKSRAKNDESIDERIVQLLTAGDEVHEAQAWELLNAKYGESIPNEVHRIYPSVNGQFDELWQETCCALLKLVRQGRLNPSTISLRPLLLQLARACEVNKTRSTSIERRYRPIYYDNLRKTRRDPNHWEEVEAVFGLIVGYSEGLPDKQRQVLRARYKDGKWPKQIAKELGVSVRKVEKLLERAKIGIRNMLRDYGEYDFGE